MAHAHNVIPEINKQADILTTEAMEVLHSLNMKEDGKHVLQACPL